ncbi:hypothetical protein BY458DRAFT_528859 [Sporodiniella umbellata]|nr:hypothetical protein BY458DRAFT_528859 [Sporodiniella umbellata]
MTYSLECPTEENTILWMGNLEPWMNEEYIEDMWSSFAKVATVKVIKDRLTGLCAGYGFVDFGSGVVARMIIKHFNGFCMPNSTKTLRLNWASGGGDKRGEFSIFIGDLGQQTTENEILNVFKSRYASCTAAKIMKDVMTGLSRGYGFVRFSDPLDQQRALFEMQSFIIGARPIRVSMATPKQKSPSTTPINYNKTTMSTGGLSSSVTEDQLRQCFSPFGDVVFVRIPHGENYGSIQFTTRSAAELAINRMNGNQNRNSRTVGTLNIVTLRKLDVCY